MRRLLIHVEGPTEEDFVNEVLRDYLLGIGYSNVSARIVGNARARDRRGGIRPWPQVKKDIVTHLRQDPGCVATTIVDYYGLPQDGDGAWPGRREAARLANARKAETVEAALLADLGKQCDPSRFVPFVMMHEFEALLFSDCAAFSREICRPELEATLQSIRDAFPTPEDINDSPETAPSKRLQALIPGYQKPLLGTLGALEIGLEAMRRECPHFDAWISRLELLAA
ncbi:MAG: DUF4276 family protein [Bryobacterales bacterium]|nr:DUF4276 family protein [Bryobacterales bacterium]